VGFRTLQLYSQWSVHSIFSSPHVLIPRELYKSYWTPQSHYHCTTVLTQSLEITQSVFTCWLFNYRALSRIITSNLLITCLVYDSLSKTVLGDGYHSTELFTAWLLSAKAWLQLNSVNSRSSLCHSRSQTNHSLRVQSSLLSAKASVQLSIPCLVHHWLVTLSATARLQLTFLVADSLIYPPPDNGKTVT
jgi:hypothetical protein